MRILTRQESTHLLEVCRSDRPRCVVRVWRDGTVAIAGVDPFLCCTLGSIITRDRAL